MGKILLYIITCATIFFTFIDAFIGVTAYYLLAVLGPQYIWWWVFGNFRVSFVVGIFTVISIFIKLLIGKLNKSFLFTKMNFFVLLLWISMAISYFFGPYVDVPDYKIFLPHKLFIDSIKIFFFYLFATLAVDNLKKIKLFSFILVISVLYLAYWANIQYFSHNWHQFNMGRLQGPMSIYGTSIYKDENVFAMLFVCGLPFLVIFPFLIKFLNKSRFLKYLFWISVPFTIHAVFLTGSRGGLIGIFVVAFFGLLISRRKIIGLFFILALVFFYYWQAGDIMKQRSHTISQYEQESSARQRLNAWIGGLRMIKKYPFTGVGLGSFITALPEFYPTNPRVAHNTFIQFAAESGLLAGFSYIMILILFYINAFKTKRILSYKEDQNLQCLNLINSANTTAFTGLVVCGLFLSLNFYEIFFYLLLINNNISVIVHNST